ncbi:lipocalin-like domain-containing protein [Mycobacterium sp. URHB0044]|uniref:lipocalin-like domain-containing protein n=1 Tax=Mycobacterium sp. URHB0044 TaxID=1380386 RepID=UPI000490EE79|nr:lipocalin-like domain-containing protein [Mycobacterium sp. URHB0044]
MRQKTAPTDQTTIHGVWRLKSYYLENLQTGERTHVFGSNPNGVLTLLPEGRMFALLTPGERTRPETEADEANAFRNLLAYSGRYRLEPPDRFVTTVDVASLESWVGSEQARKFRLHGDALDITIGPARMSLTGDAMVMNVLSWVRERNGALKVTA